jgi:hypothetical protein
MSRLFEVNDNHSFRKSAKKDAFHITSTRKPNLALCGTKSLNGIVAVSMEASSICPTCLKKAETEELVFPKSSFVANLVVVAVV